MCFGDRRHFQRDFVQRRPADECLNRAGRNLQIDHRPIAHIGPRARQPVRIIAVPLQVFAPCLAPESGGDGAARDAHGRNGVPLLLALLQLAQRFAPPLRHRNIGPPSVKRHPSILLQRPIDIERHQLEQFVVFQLRQEHPCAALQ